MIAAINNPIILALGIGNFFAAGYSYYNGDWKVCGVFAAYGVANLFLCLVKA